MPEHQSIPSALPGKKHVFTHFPRFPELCSVLKSVCSPFTMAARTALLLQPFEPAALIADLEHQAWGRHRPLCPPCATHHGPCLTPASPDEGRLVWGSTRVLCCASCPYVSACCSQMPLGSFMGLISDREGEAPPCQPRLLLSLLSPVSQGSAES